MVADETPSVRIDIDIESNITEQGERKFKNSSVSMSKEFAQKARGIQEQDEAKQHKIVNREIKQIHSAITRLSKHDEKLEKQNTRNMEKITRKNEQDFKNFAKSIRKTVTAENKIRVKDLMMKTEKPITTPRDLVWSYQDVKEQDFETPLPSSSTKGSVVPSPRDVKSARKSEDMAIMSKTAKQLVREQKAADAEARVQARDEHKKYKATIVKGKLPLGSGGRPSDSWAIMGAARTDDPIRQGRASPIFPQGLPGKTDRKTIPLEERKFMEFLEKKTQKVGGMLYTGMRGGALMGDAERFMTTNMLRGLASKGGIIGSMAAIAITSALGAPKVANSMIQLITRKGSPFNMDYRRYMEQETNALWDIEDKKRRMMGLDAYIITQHDSYSPVDGTPVYNSYENRQETRVSKIIGLAEKAVGIE